MLPMRARNLLLTSFCSILLGSPGLQAQAPQTAKAQASEDGAAAVGEAETSARPAKRKEERRNAIALGFTHSFQILRPSGTEDEVRGTNNLFGFAVAYERELIAQRLALLVAKPFHFGGDRFDSPVDVFLKVLFPKGRWEPFLGAGVSGNLRVFSGELEQEEGRRVEYTFGVGAMTGVSYAFTPRWGLALDVGYLYFVNGLAEHSIVDALYGVFFF
jgi:opacity protein-like surface antigen